MTHRGPFQPLLFCDSVIYIDEIPSSLLFSRLNIINPVFFMKKKYGRSH